MGRTDGSTIHRFCEFFLVCVCVLSLSASFNLLFVCNGISTGFELRQCLYVQCFEVDLVAPGLVGA